MAGRHTSVPDVREMVRRLREPQDLSGIARDLKVSRKTVKAYRRLAVRQGWLTAAELPGEEAIARGVEEKRLETRPAVVSVVEPHRAMVQGWLDAGVPAKAIFTRLRTEHAFLGSYSSVYRFVRALSPRTPEGYVRIETAPGEEAQVDFGYAGLLFDPKHRKLRKAWIFVMTLSFSRHLYVEFVFDQTVPTFVRCHANAFRFIGGVPKRVRIDNLKAGVIEAALYDPVLNRIYRECAEHYGFLITVCPPETPEHKGKTEAMVKYAKNHLVKGRAWRDVVEANEKGLSWCLEVAGKRVHQTTKRIPIEQYDRFERPALKALPLWDYEAAEFRLVKVHPDCHVVYEGSYYSAPFRLIGQELLLRASAHTVHLYHAHMLVAAHDRAPFPGTRRTKVEHYPPEKAACVLATPLWCRKKAHEVGPATEDVITRLLADHPLDRLRGVQAILAQEKKYGKEKLEKACRRALYFGALEARRIKTMLQKGLEDDPLPEPTGTDADAGAASSFPRLFARPADEFFGLEQNQGE